MKENIESSSNNKFDIYSRWKYGAFNIIVCNLKNINSVYDSQNIILKNISGTNIRILKNKNLI